MFLDLRLTNGPLCIAMLATVLLVSPQAVCEEPVSTDRKDTFKQRRILTNLDGYSHMFLKGDKPPFKPVAFSEDDLRQSVREATPPGHQLDTLLLTTNCQAMYYPTKKGTKFCALVTEEELAELDKICPGAKQWRDNLEYFYSRGLDPYAIIFDEAKKRGLETILSFRMNDNHNLKFERTQFWVDHPECRLGGALDFGYKETREYVFGLMQEAVQRYNMVDGFEMDFNRFPTFFTNTPQKERIAHINDLVRRVRKMLDREGKKRNNRLLLAVRVPSDYGNAPTNYEVSLKAGCDPVHWAKQGWIDFLTVSEFLRERFSLPIKEWQELITEIPIYGGIECGRGKGPVIRMSRDDFRRAAQKRWAEGADGLYLFNFHTTRERMETGAVSAYDLFLEIGNPTTK